MNKQAFTLIEILVVVAIVGILSGFIFYTVQNNVSKANIAKSQVFSESIRNNLLLNLVSEWKLDNNANDAWGTNNGTWYGSGGGTITSETYLSSSQCISGQCMEFDGTDDYISVASDSSLNITEAITIGVWINPALGAHDKIITKDATWLYERQPFQVGFDSTGKRIRVYMGDGTTPYSAAAPADNDANIWSYIVVTYDGSSIVVYKDGVAGTAVNRTGSLYTNTANVNIARWGSGYFYDGIVDEVRIYNSALSSSQVRQNYLSGLIELLSRGLISEEEYNKRISEI